ncbi:hypothetical protein SAMN05421823_103245 [Catalinimonas alkaloidigena]|uniref:Carboxypeptidase regulatory-like domain-containing protein n=1 Tax=Catalinimonas alkaloidigena TaxID=1075417 RepID=A0A1G9DTN7_9BACT|nr:hypothetical protein [Catalinimonas alkaloidigena]SDK67214.1 hypothetical protein SAMN05421823_103245 [Catalinimonas alkaloidigena]
MNLSTLFSRKTSWAALLIVFFLCTAEECTSAQDDVPVGCSEPLQQGLRGVVTFKSGNLMPGPDLDPRAAAGQPVVREVYIFPLTKLSEAFATEAPFYDSLATEPIAVAQSDSTGCFQVRLPAGHYSVFVREKDRYYANGFDGDGYIFPVDIEEDEVTDISFDIDYEAAY